MGITFAVYGAKDEDGAGTEWLIPFDLIPQIITTNEWKSMQDGLVPHYGGALVAALLRPQMGSSLMQMIHPSAFRFL